MSQTTRLKAVGTGASAPAAPRTGQVAAAAVSEPPGLLALLRAAVWFGLLAGLVEGLLFLLVHALGRTIFAGTEIVWIAAAFDTLLFVLAGLCLAAVARVLPRLPIALLASFSFAFLTWLGWLAVLFEPYVRLYALVLLAAGLAAQTAYWMRRYRRATDRFIRSSLKWLAAAGLASVLIISGGKRVRESIAIRSLPAAPAGAPNVLVIVIDALRADHLSSYGYARRTSPNIDRFAREGVRFTRALSTASYTLASHASMLSGLYPNRHGAEWTTANGYMSCDCENVATFLRENGYRTAAFSANQFWFTHEHGFDRGFIRFEDYFPNIVDMAIRTAYGRAIEHFLLPALGVIDIPGRKRAADVNRAALDWIGEDSEHPFFVFLNYFDVHDPYLPPQPYRGRFSDTPDPGGVVNWRFGDLDPQLTPEQRETEIAAYDGAIAYVDDYVGRLVAELDERGLADNTLVVITSDHGEEFGEHGMYLHGYSLYREVIHVPLVFWYGGRIAAGRVIEQPVSNASIPATVVDFVPTLAGLNPFSGSLAPAIKPAPANSAGRDGWRPTYPLAELVRKPWAVPRAPIFHGAMKSLVSPRWHYIEHETLGDALYAWEADPLEANNLVDRPELSAVVQDFKARLRKLRPSP